MVHVWWILITIGVGWIIYRRTRGKCRHIWKSHDRQLVGHMSKSGKQVEQEIETLICQSCGEIVSINLTTGKSETLVEGGPAYSGKL